MAHKRKGIRDKVFTKLNGNITYGGQPVNVYQTRAIPYWRVQLPAVSFYLFQEDADHQESAPREYWRNLQLAIQILVKETQGTITDDIIDDIADQVEKIFFLDPTIDDTIDDMALVNTSVAIKDDGEIIYSAAVLIFNLEYRTDAPEFQPSLAVDLQRSGTSIGIDSVSVSSIGATITYPTIGA